MERWYCGQTDFSLRNKYIFVDKINTNITHW
jgi:hypothetical protein